MPLHLLFAHSLQQALNGVVADFTATGSTCQILRPILETKNFQGVHDEHQVISLEKLSLHAIVELT